MKVSQYGAALGKVRMGVTYEGTDVEAPEPKLKPTIQLVQEKEKSVVVQEPDYSAILNRLDVLEKTVLTAIPAPVEIPPFPEIPEVPDFRDVLSDIHTSTLRINARLRNIEESLVPWYTRLWNWIRRLK